MSGNKQHHIPQSVLRAFRIPGKGKRAHHQVFVFRKDKHFPSSTEGIGAQRHFYSEPTPDGTRTLDDIITEYENHFLELLKQLRSLEIGENADSRIAAEVVGHITIRNDHLRRTLTNWTGRLADQAVELFCKEDKLRAMFGLDGAEFPPRILDTLNNHIESDKRFRQIGLPKDVIHKIAFMTTRENFSRFVANQLPLFQSAIESFSADAPDHVRRTHNEILLDTFVANRRTEAMSSFKWTVRSAPPEGAILPDCVTLGSEDGHPLQPLVLADLEKLTNVAMPLSPQTILLGCKPGFGEPNLKIFNEAAASSSGTFFISHRNGQDLQILSALIGTGAQKTLEHNIALAFEGFKKQRNDQQTDAKEESSSASIDNDETTPNKKPPDDWSISFKGISDEETAYRIGALIKVIVQELRRMMPLDGLDGFTFAEDYETALTEIDRGFTTSSTLQHGKREYGVGVSMSPIVVRNGVLKTHIVSRMWIALKLISENEDEQLTALHTIVNQLAFVSCHQMFDEALPGFLLSQISDPLDALLYPGIESAWSGYFAARASSIFDPSFSAAHFDLAISSIRHGQETILSARYNYRFDGNLDHFLTIVLVQITDILRFCSQLLGHCDGLRNSPFENETLNTLLLERDLLYWIELFQADLAKIWNRQGRWESVDELTILQRHVERLLWHFGIFPWKNPDGSIYIKVPIQTDAHLFNRPRAIWRWLRTRTSRAIKGVLLRLR